jgi:hypothetical protein
MLPKPENRVLRALLWCVILFVPGGFLLLALVLAGVMHRRDRQGALRLPEHELANVSLPSMSSGPV